MKYKLYSDSEVWHKEYGAEYGDEEIAFEEGVRGELTTTAQASDYTSYIADATGFEFTITYVY